MSQTERAVGNGRSHQALVSRVGPALDLPKFFGARWVVEIRQWGGK